MLTPEQEAVVKAKFSRGDILKVSAFAGTGKTHTLLHLVKRLEVEEPDWKVLYLAFNKSVQMEANNKFPRNVMARTIHSLAWSYIGHKYRHKLVSDLRVKLLCESLNMPPKFYLQVKYAIETLSNYLVSAKKYISDKHCPGIETKYVAKFNKIDVVELTKKIWKLMQDPEDKKVGMLHDGYLKLFELEKTKLEYDVILFDECQDANPVTTEIILNQDHALRVMVGDPHQQIYSFRGAVNAFTRVQTDQNFSLTGSFRFNQTVANVANLLLGEYKGENRKLIGLGKKGVLEKIDATLPHAILTRTNAGIFDQATEFSNSKLGFLGGIQNYKLSMINDVYYIFTQQKDLIKNFWLKRFDDMDDIEAYAKDLSDIELTSLVKTVKKFTHEIPKLLKSIEDRTVANLHQADVLLSTTHKAKGFEFKRVRLHDDFLDFYEEKNTRKAPDLISPDEINLYYVAVTRAKEVLQINRRLTRNLAWLKKKYA